MPKMHQSHCCVSSCRKLIDQYWYQQGYKCRSCGGRPCRDCTDWYYYRTYCKECLEWYNREGTTGAAYGGGEDAEFVREARKRRDNGEQGNDHWSESGKTLYRRMDDQWIYVRKGYMAFSEKGPRRLVGDLEYTR